MNRKGWLLASTLLGTMVLLAGCSEATVKQSIEKSLDAEGIQAMVIEAGDGDLTIIGDESAKEITAVANIRTTEDDLDRVEFELKQDGDHAVLKSNFEEKAGLIFSFINREIDVTVTVPAELAIDIRHESGNLAARDVKGSVTIKDDSGNIELKNMAQLASLEDDSGNLEIADSRVDMKIEDESGNIRVARTSGNLTIEDQSGELEIEDHEGNLEIRDDSGNLKVRNVRGDVVVRDASGNIEVREVDGDLDIKEAGSGEVDVDGIKGTYSN